MKMGLLPSQEYDNILLAFCDYLGEDIRRLISIECDEYEEMVREYLKKCDNGELNVYGELEIITDEALKIIDGINERCKRK